MVEVNKTAWGNLTLEIAEASAEQTMPVALEQLGWIEEGSISLDVARGTKLELKETGGIVRDSKENEPTITVKMDILGIPEAMRTKFWDSETALGKTTVKSLVTDKKFALKISNPKIIGSDTLEIPYTTVFMSPLLSDDKGYRANLEFTILKGIADYLFDMDTVKE